MTDDSVFLPEIIHEQPLCLFHVILLGIFITQLNLSWRRGCFN